MNVWSFNYIKEIKDPADDRKKEKFSKVDEVIFTLFNTHI